MVLTVEKPRASGDSQVLPTAEIAEHLARHGLDVSAARTVVTDGLSPADALLDYASDIGADLLVVGGYGHSRTREMIMGGVTREPAPAHDGTGADVALRSQGFRPLGWIRRSALVGADNAAVGKFEIEAAILSGDAVMISGSDIRPRQRQRDR